VCVSVRVCVCVKTNQSNS